MIKMDLHMHTNYSSDGQFSVAEIVKKVKEAKVNVFAIADHNTTKGVCEYIKHFKEDHLTHVSAIEIDCMIHETHLHVLGYGIDPTFKKFDDLHNYYFDQDVKNSELLVKKIEQLDIHVQHDFLTKLSRNGVITGEMIAEVVLADKRNEDHPLLVPFFKGNARSDNPYVNFYWDLCAINKPAYVETSYISINQAVDMIHTAGGLAILAHPGNNVFESETLMKDIFNQGVIGLETYSSYHTKKQVDYYNKLAIENKWLQTIGSDFHGKTKPSISIGQCVSYEGDDVLFHQLSNKLTSK